MGGSYSPEYRRQRGLARLEMIRGGVLKRPRSVPRGTWASYCHWVCRCVRCKAAATKYNRKMYLRKKRER